MKHQIISPLIPMQVDRLNGGRLPFFELLGAGMDLLRCSPWQGRQSVDDFAVSAVNAYIQDRVLLALTPDARPYGFAIWQKVNQEQHDRWLAAPPIGGSSEVAELHADQQGAYLWITCLIVPFTTPLPLYRLLRERHFMNETGWALSPDRACVRKLW